MSTIDHDTLNDHEERIQVVEQGTDALAARLRDLERDVEAFGRNLATVTTQPQPAPQEGTLPPAPVRATYWMERAERAEAERDAARGTCDSLEVLRDAALADAAMARGECAEYREALQYVRHHLQHGGLYGPWKDSAKEFIDARYKAEIRDGIYMPVALSPSPPPATWVECQDAWHNGASTFTGQSDCPTCKSPFRYLRNIIATPPQPSPVDPNQRKETHPKRWSPGLRQLVDDPSTTANVSASPAPAVPTASSPKTTRGRVMGKRKFFDAGEVIEINPRSRGWVRGTYVKHSEERGWHHVRDDAGIALYLPSRRLRTAKEPTRTKPEEGRKT